MRQQHSLDWHSQAQKLPPAWIPPPASQGMCLRSSSLPAMRPPCGLAAQSTGHCHQLVLLQHRDRHPISVARMTEMLISSRRMSAAALARLQEKPQGIHLEVDAGPPQARVKASGSAAFSPGAFPRQDRELRICSLFVSTA